MECRCQIEQRLRQQAMGESLSRCAAKPNTNARTIAATSVVISDWCSVIEALAAGSA